MECFRHDPGKLCPMCGLDRRAKMKLKVQAQHLQPGDVVGSGDVVKQMIVSSIHWPSTKVFVGLEGKLGSLRAAYWGKYTMIAVEREEKV